MPQPALDTHAEVRKLKQAGCTEEQAEAMVELVNQAPLNAQVAGSLEQMQLRLDSIKAAMAIKASLEALTSRVASIESTMTGMATKSDLKVLRAETKAGLESLRADMSRMIWIQSGVLGTLILGLATIMLGLAL